MGRGVTTNVDGIVLASLFLTHCYSVLAILDKKGSYIEDEPRRNYRVEDFFWSGSGDGQGSGDGNGEATWATTTIFRTTTILTTIYPTPVFPSSTCNGDSCSISPTPTFTIEPTASVFPPITISTPPPYYDVPDQRYWLVTVIEANTTALDLSPAVFEQRLAQLYRTAFHRQQERHLGLSDDSNQPDKRNLKRERRETVSVRVHRVSGGASRNNVLELVYTVRVAGKAVDASVAAQDMRLVADNEVTAQLGFPVLTKAEPFLKPAETAQSSSQNRDILLIVGASITTLILILLLILLFVFKLSKRKKKMAESQTGIFQRETTSGRENLGFHDEPDTEKSRRRGGNEGGSLSNESEVSVDGMVTRVLDTPPEPRARPRSHKPSSPHSYLSMPSVKAFPRGAPIPGPLEKVLEPENTNAGNGSHALSRHSSASADPGVVGPLVWDLHCHRLNKKDCEENSNGEVEPSVGRMRRRFHELLDDAFSLFGSRSGTPEEDDGTPTHAVYGRAKSAVIMPVDSLSTDKKLRPKTSDGRPATAGLTHQPRGAWGSSPPETPTPSGAPPRPLSAGPFHKPTLEPAWILSDSILKPTDPAVPLIEAIKHELDKFPAKIPGAYRM